MQPHKHSFDAIGTRWTIETYRPLTRKCLEQVEQVTDDFEQTFSRFRDSSLVRQIANAAGTYHFPNTALKIFDFYDELYEATDGAVTPLIGNVLEAMGYDGHYTLQKVKAELPVTPSWSETIRRQGTVITATSPCVIDIGAAGKGYLIDTIGELLRGYGYEDFVIDGSGDILHYGSMENIVGLEDPRDARNVVGSVAVTNRALCASATNRRLWGENVHHIVDPYSKKSVETVIATWVVADTAMVADGIATALFLCSPKKLRLTYNYEYARMHKDGSIEYSDYFRDRLY